MHFSDTVSFQDKLRRLVYRSKYTSRKELDIILGQFVHLHVKSQAELEQMEMILAVGDHVLYDWLVNKWGCPVEVAHLEVSLRLAEYAGRLGAVV